MNRQINPKTIETKALASGKIVRPGKWQRPPEPRALCCPVKPPARAVLAIACCLSVPAGAQGPALAAVLAGVRKAHDLPALACVVFRGGSVLEEAAVGVRKAGDPAAVTLDDRFHVGSITNSMTATLAALLVRDGTIRWGSSTQEVLGSSIPGIHPDYRGITLRQWLQHRGGAPHDPPPPLWSELWKRGDQPAAANREWFVGEVLRERPAQPAGTFTYSNTGYMVAGLMLEKAAGRPWEELMRSRVFRPLGLRSAGFGPAGQAGTPDQPWGHRQGRPVPPGPEADNPPALGPAGTVHCSIRDLARYAAFHLREGQGQPGLLDESAFAELHRPPPGDPANPQAMGWLRVPRPWAGGDALTHNGSNTMNFAVVWIAPQRDFGLVVATNQGGADAEKALDEVATAMVGKYCGRQQGQE